MDADAEVGPDWRNALSEWVERHAYYPTQARELGQVGAPRVVVTVLSDGTVTSVELEKRSGSQWLDLGLEGLFRGAKLPPLPKQFGEPFVMHFTMYYMGARK
jgi:TonB family protein